MPKNPWWQRRSHGVKFPGLLLLLLLVFPSVSKSEGIRILCLGDSITAGSNSENYRPFLAKKLADAGIAAEFVGPNKDKGGLAHAGYGGKSAEAVLAADRKFHGRFPADMILIHSGHNHKAEEKPIPGIITAIEAMIAQAREDNPKVKVLLAKVITSGKLPKYSYIPELNREIGDLGKKLQVTVVDQAEGFDWKADAIADHVHPNAAGAEKMAAKWFDAIKALQ